VGRTLPLLFKQNKPRVASDVVQHVIAYKPIEREFYLYPISKWREHQLGHPQLAIKHLHHQNNPMIVNRKAPSVAEQDQPGAKVQT
jgi:hypothetical protein